MKKLFILGILLLTPVCISVAQLKSQVNECFELTSIVFRLAEAHEYVNNQLSDYTNKIDSYFAEHKNHELIHYIKEIRNEYGIGYDAVAGAAGVLDIKNEKVVVKSDVNISQINELDNRWSEQNFKSFVDLLNDFYQKTKFRNFYTQHVDLYHVAEERMDELLKNFNIDWFKSLFENNIQSPMIVVSLCNGPNNYAFYIPGKNRKNGMVIGCGVDKEGLPVFGKDMVSIVAHEFLHNYANPRISDCWNQIDSSAQVIYSHVEDQMRKRAYGSAKITMYEWFTRLLTIMYLRDNPTPNISWIYQIRQDQVNGFIWMDRAVTFMEHFGNNRNLFATIDNYMPQIVGFINFTATKFDQVLNEFENRRPYITDVFPAPGTTITRDIDTITIRFSESMYGAHGMKPIDDKDILSTPLAGMPSWKDKNMRTFVIALDKSRLETGKTYGFKLNHDFFQSAKIYPMKEDYTYTFKTEDK